MSSTIIEQDFPYDIIHRGKRDEGRHNKRVDEAARRQLKDIISQQDIITSEGNKKIKVKLKHLNKFRFKHNQDFVDVVGRDQFDELDKDDIIYKPNPNLSSPTNGNESGEEVYEAEYTVNELTDLMTEELELPSLNETKKNEIVSEVIEWEDLRKRTGVRSLLDRRKTLLANIKRRAKLKTKERLPFIDEDLRFRTWDIRTQKHSNAVIFLLMDRSGSMWNERIYAVKALYFWIVQFLRRKYDKVEIKFIAHDYEAKEMSEKDFFSISDSGGTRVSSAYNLCHKMISGHYPTSHWNIYCFHASDGDSWSDEEECIEIVSKIIDLGANLFAYTEIDIDNFHNGGQSKLLSLFKKFSYKNPKVMSSVIESTSDILGVLEKFLKHQTE